MNILFVDDEKIIREGMKVIINWQGVGCEKFVMAENASMALAVMEQEPFDLVITDIYMQKMSGIELAGQIKERWPLVKVIVLSAYEDFSYARQAIEAGVFKYLLKPITPDELESAVNEAMTVVYRNQHLESLRQESEQLVRTCRPQLIRDFWKALLRSEFHNQEDLARRGKLAGILLPEGACCCIAVSLQMLAGQWPEPLAGELCQSFFSSCIGWLALEPELFVIILPELPEEGKLLDFLSLLAEHLQAEVRGACGRSVPDIIELSRSFDEAVLVLKNAANKNGDQEALITASLQMIRQNLNNEQFAVNDVARALHVSGSYFSKLFKKKMGVTCIDYLTACRLDKARSLLKYTDMKQEDIAGAVGYANVHYFSIQFKRQTGETPGQFRRRARLPEEVKERCHV